MKKLHSILPIMVVAIMLLLSPVIQAEAAEGSPGQTVSVTFSFNEIRGLDGVFSFSNEAILENISYSSTFTGVRFNNNKIFYSTMDADANAGTVTVTATIKKDAAVGSTCTITLGEINITDANTNAVYSGSKSEVVSVVKEPVVTKAPVNPTATPASQSQGNNQSQNQTQVPSETKVPDQNNVTNQSSNPVVTNQPNIENNNTANASGDNATTGNSIESTSIATTSPIPSEETEDTTPDESIETNADIKVNRMDNETTGPNIWLILFIISLLANLILAAVLLWKKLLNNSDRGKDTPLVDYDIDDDLDDGINQ